MKQINVMRTENCYATMWYQMIIDEEKVNEYNTLLKERCTKYKTDYDYNPLTMEDIYNIINKDNEDIELPEYLTNEIDWTFTYMIGTQEQTCTEHWSIAQLVDQWILDDLWCSGYQDYEVGDVYDSFNECIVSE